MDSPADRQRFRLHQGVVTGSVDKGRMIKATEYRIDQSEYKVFLHQGGNRELPGTCAIESEPAGGYVVIPDFEINFDPSVCEFAGTWDTDHDGIARLQHVWMAVEGA